MHPTFFGFKVHAGRLPKIERGKRFDGTNDDKHENETRSKCIFQPAMREEIA